MSIKLTDHESIPKVINEMTLEEKASVITGGSPFYTFCIERLGIPSALLLDGGTGFNSMQFMVEMLYQVMTESSDNNEHTGMEGLLSGVSLLYKSKNPNALSKEEQEIVSIAQTKAKEFKLKGKSPGCFPPGMILGATWDPQVVYECARALGREANAFKIDVLLGSPNINIHRDPLNGRLFEGYSEDPCLVAKLAPNFVKGIQDEGVVANVKHFAANNQETERMGINEHISLRALHEIYFPGFKACVQEGEAKTVMSAYNKINGIACAQNKWLLTDVLREQWGFDGFVVSDWGGAYDQVEAAIAGNDLVMPGPRNIEPLIEAVNSGRLSEKVLDECVANFLEILLEMPVMKGRKYTAIDSNFSQEAAYRAAAEGMVLLKNNGVLPLDKKTNVSFFGEKSKKFIESGGGSAEVWTDLSTNLYDSTVDKIGKNLVSFKTITKETDTVIITVGATGQEGKDRPDMELEEVDKEMLFKVIKEAKSLGKKTVVILNIPGPVHMMDWIDDADAILCVFFPGMEGGRVATDIIFGDLNPSGKLPLTFPKFYKDSPTYGNFPGEQGEVWYGEGIFVGYRYYDFKGVEPLYPFGFGLSYTTFELSDLQINSLFDIDKETKFNIHVRLKNTGKLAGKEVIQLYVAQEESTLQKPPKELKAFKKVYLKPGEETIVKLELDKNDLASFDINLNQWTIEPGHYQILVGTSSRDISLNERFQVVGENPYGYGPNTEIERIFKDSHAVEVFKKHLPPEVKSQDVVALDLVFAPSMRLSDIWKKRFVPLLVDKTEKEIESILERIYNDLKRLDTVPDRN